jgi:hypothetical protein
MRHGRSRRSHLRLHDAGEVAGAARRTRAAYALAALLIAVLAVIWYSTSHHSSA